MIIDAHVHLPLDMDGCKAEKILLSAEKNGVSLLIVSALGNWSDYPGKEIISQANDHAREFAAYDKKKILWLAYLNPQLNNWSNELERCMRAGARGIKLWISLKDSSGSLDNTAKLLNTAAENNLPVLIHVFNRTDSNRPGEISIQEFVKLSEMAPECVIIAAHAGGNWHYTMGMLRNSRPGVYMDISGTYPEQGMLDMLVKADGADRIVFGSDAPGRSFYSQLSKILFSGINIEDKDKILWKNAAKLYGIDSIPSLLTLNSNHSEIIIQNLPEFSEDHFCFCGNLPFFPSACKEPEDLERLLIANSIKSAYVGDLSGIFYLDLITANHEFLRKCRGFSVIKPLGMLNPVASNWHLTVEDLAEKPYAGAIIYPYLHNWKLDAPEFSEFFSCCSEHGVRLWINCAVADHRFRHRTFNFREIVYDELISFMQNAPENKYVFQGVESTVQKKLLKMFNSDSRFYFDISRLTDKQFFLAEILKSFGCKRLVAGSEFPFRHPLQVKQTALNILN